MFSSINFDFIFSHLKGPQTCTVCGRVSTNMKSLAKHKKIHLEGSKERFKCIVCGKGFRDRTKLKVKHWHLTCMKNNRYFDVKLK